MDEVEQSDEVSGVFINLAARVVNRGGEAIGQLHEAVIDIESEELVGFLVVTVEGVPREVFVEVEQIGEMEPDQLILDLTDQEIAALPDAREHLYVAADQDVEAEIDQAESATASPGTPDPGERPTLSAIPGFALTPNMLTPLEVERSVIGEGEFALRHGMRIRTDDGEEIGQIEGAILDDDGRLLALALLGEEGEAILFSAIDTIDDDNNELIIVIADEDDEAEDDAPGE
jgi:sporulation protein YlmC with PRC-barrel domain